MPVININFIDRGVENSMVSTLILAAQTVVPSTTPWNLSVASIMIFCNILAIVIGYFAIQNTGKGPDLPFPQLASKKSFGLPELLATASFGHILGAGMILGLSSAGIL
jgi:photosystem I subunit 10